MSEGTRGRHRRFTPEGWYNGSVKTECIRFAEPGEPSVLTPGTLEIRALAPQEVLVAVAASAVNRADLLQRRGLYPAPPGAPPDVLGLEYAGTIGAIGDAVRDRAVGDRVMGILAGGGYARHVVVHERETILVPREMSLTDAAAIPEVFLTAWDALFVRAALRPGATLLVHAVGSGVGTAAIQVGKLVGATVIGTARSAGKLEAARPLGLSHGIHVDGKSPRFADETIARSSRGDGADVILDGVGAAYLEENVRALRTLGTCVVIGLLGGATGSLSLAALLHKRASLVGTVLRARPLEEKIAIARLFEAEAAPALESGALRPIVAATMPMAEAAEAHRRLEASEVFGKIVLAW